MQTFKRKREKKVFETPNGHKYTQKVDEKGVFFEDFTPNGHKYTQKVDEKGKHVFFEDFPEIAIGMLEEDLWEIDSEVFEGLSPFENLDAAYEKLQQSKNEILGMMRRL
jgi:hypothetical protein